MYKTCTTDLGPPVQIVKLKKLESNHFYFKFERNLS